MKFMLKAGLIEAVQYRRDENIHEVQYFFEITKENGKKLKYYPEHNGYGVIVLAEGNVRTVHMLKPGEYILRHIDGNYEVMDEQTFKESYGRVRN